MQMFIDGMSYEERRRIYSGYAVTPANCCGARLGKISNNRAVSFSDIEIGDPDDPDDYREVRLFVETMGLVFSDEAPPNDLQLQPWESLREIKLGNSTLYVRQADESDALKVWSYPCTGVATTDFMPNLEPLSNTPDGVRLNWMYFGASSSWDGRDTFLNESWNSKDENYIGLIHMSSMVTRVKDWINRHKYQIVYESEPVRNMNYDVDHNRLFYFIVKQDKLHKELPV